MVIQMKVRLGYVALSKALDDVTTSSTITYTNYINKNYNTSKLLEITKNNLDSLYKIIKYNVKNIERSYYYSMIKVAEKLGDDDLKHQMIDNYYEISECIREDLQRINVYNVKENIRIFELQKSIKK